jgi:hypothetical protein
MASPINSVASACQRNTGKKGTGSVTPSPVGAPSPSPSPSPITTNTDSSSPNFFKRVNNAIFS